MSSSSSLLLLPSLAPQTPLLRKSNPTPPSLLSFSSPSLLFNNNNLCANHSSALSPSSFTGLALQTLSSSRFVPRVASVPSEFDQEDGEEEGFFGGSRSQSSFAPDLKLFVGNLPFRTDSSSLAELFQQAGNVQMVEVIYDKITGRSRGFGFVTMSSMEEVEAAAQQFNGYEFEGRSLRVNFGPRPPRREEPYSRGGGGGGGGGSFSDGNQLYVGNLSWGVDDLALQTLFSEQGRVLEARVVFDRESGRSRGFGFVTYSSAEEVHGAIRALDGADLDGRPIRVSVAESKTRRLF